MAAGGNARPFEYPEGANENQKERIRVKTLRGKKDTLFYDTDAEGEKCNLMLCSNLVREWLNAMKEQYPELEEERQGDTIVLKCKEGTITLKPTVTVVVTGELMDSFEEDFQKMKRMALPPSLLEGMAELGINNTGVKSRPFEYPQGSTDEQKKRFRKETLRNNKDTLRHDTNAKGKICNLTFYSTHAIEWLNAMKKQYPEFEEKQQDSAVSLKSDRGTITSYPTVTVLVRGQILMDSFKRHFPAMKQMALPPSLLETMVELDSTNTGVISRSFEYPQGSTDQQKERVREETLRDNKDTLYHDTTLLGKICNLTFYSTHVIEWLNAMKKQYPAFREIQRGHFINLKSDMGTITLYPKVTVVVEGQLMERFEDNFPQMKQMAGLVRKAREPAPDFPRLMRNIRRMKK
ncbi:uncharacterized protein LOC119478922 isoform X2 [Sebastes umbrosus]|uniref:uncharacterized protein LOC119478922 isoform X2 n=1 Tax=Sebastes umbrosus TaxID=72105 RepID=UPI0018A00160|nr:uncharacterized protein LOC119478922 isoform X2 [Sebastes umbrosus]XP_037609940.1 uncharacterized protein LOC119478922 isoform X2 [Sebastes umbrosus]XP_037609942.1 uncharacterized protein LOC119478922 isoform X2 [Sebastes umbrosus]XP_037609943.1 uncharacterized protein LOC119478922 isoform X2 [Sebastes umbrosus]